MGSRSGSCAKWSGTRAGTRIGRALPLVCGDVVQLVRTPACHAGGRGFESRRSRQTFDPNSYRLLSKLHGSITFRIADQPPNIISSYNFEPKLTAKPQRTEEDLT